MKRDPASDEYMRAVEDALDIAVQSVEHAIVLEIASALKGIDPNMSQAEIAKRAAILASKVGKIAERGDADVEKAVSAVMGELAEANAEWGAPYYEAAGAVMGAAATEAVEEGRKQAVRRVGELMKTSAMEIAVKEGDGLRSKPIRDAYRSIVTAASKELAQGTGTPQKAVSKAVTSALGHMCESGVRIRYESGATRELYGAVRMNVMDAYRSAMQAGREAMGREFGADGVEISAHGTCAPDHLPYQGRTYSNEDFAEIQGSLERPIARGYNCRHTVHPVIMGALKPAHTDEELRRIEEYSTEKVAFKGLRGEEITMTRYEATQYQRRLEQRIRKANLEAECAAAAGTDPAPHKARAGELRKVYREMSASCGLAADLKRTRVHIPSSAR